MDTFVKYVDHMGDDLSVVNAARVSFDKKSEYILNEDGTESLPEQDKKLINYLANHNHWTPFAHTSVTLHVKAPIFVARQLGKHQVGLVWNEISRRYVNSSPEFFWPALWRGSPENKKQGSTGYIEDFEDISNINHEIFELYTQSKKVYESLLKRNVAPEQARMILPQSLMTEWYWTGSIAAFNRICSLRLAKDSQKETKDIAEKIFNIIGDLYPVSWEALENAR